MAESGCVSTVSPGDSEERELPEFTQGYDRVGLSLVLLLSGGRLQIVKQEDI